ncbi:sensor histidine kinase [Terriglobus aquaticus]|uniref:Two-component regulator propeller domain-containing protein n=1 Tax=Terriglobus aquaticus TaxID=940139 RepID=A0ABW9KK92_9BACT|nr:sensor histidine kinase [Terriglobus aquaticus]
MKKSLQCIAVAILLAGGVSSKALESDAQLSQLGHTAWRIRDGAFKGAVNGVTQTADGFLWIATDNGLLKYDGVRFTQVGSGTILALQAAQDGSLWFGTGQSLFHLRSGQVEKLQGPDVHVNSIRQDVHGTIWFTRSRSTSGPLCEVVGSKFHCLTAADGVTLPYAEALAADAKGDLWVASGSRLLRDHSGIFREFPHPELSAAETSNGIESLTPRADGSMLVGITRAGAGLGLQSLKDGIWHDAYSDPISSSDWSVTSTLVDRDGTVWVGTSDKGLFRIRQDGIDRFGESDGLSGNAVSSLFEDDEGDVWVGTKKGLDRFRNLAVTTFSTTEGLGSDSVHSVAASLQGGVWVGNKGSLSLLRDGKAINYSPKTGLPGQRVTALLEDHAGRLWVGVDADLYVLEKGRFTRVLDSEGHATGAVVSIEEDTEQNVWVLASRRPYALFRLSSASRALEVQPLGFDPDAIVADPAGGIFIDGGKHGTPLVHFQRGSTETWTPKTVIQRTSFAFAKDGSRWASTFHGVELFNRQESRFLDKSHGLPCNHVFSVVFDKLDNLWVYSECGVISISNSELSKFKTDSRYSVRSHLFDIFDGALPNGADFAPRLTRSTDGRLWFANGTDVQEIDPSHAQHAAAVPNAEIDALVARHVEQAAVSGVNLPALTRDVDLKYTAPALAIPERVRFRYRLDGHDKEWQDSTTLRDAFYTDLRPGRYTFRVVSGDADGNWSRKEAQFSFTILPAWYQTKTFLALCAALGSLVIVLAYRLRIRQIRREAQARYDERLAERTRIARDIHDTLLQTIQGSKMLADTALVQMSEHDQAKPRVQLLSTWLGNAMEEGRTALRSLRTPVIEQQSLASLIEDALDDCALSSKIITALDVAGEPTAMSVCVREEVYRIAYEAITNACLHSEGTRLDVLLTYGEAFELQVKDDGIGIASELVKEGRLGHYGLAGMRERARFLGAVLTFTGSPGEGTEVLLRVPHSRLLENARPSIWVRIARLIRGERH